MKKINDNEFILNREELKNLFEESWKLRSLLKALESDGTDKWELYNDTIKEYLELYGVEYFDELAEEDINIIESI